ncbi:AAA family ATPase [Streptomyces sp. GbtcB7]|uniref:AAA family ATPase n=1 Tax=Streptomyces sp. GbtcB7 TaxID=2824752 RepID=UPI001C2FB048|nr:LuxR family transcriptional regulator [Streptomyces sp. GbtcB7]
MSLIGRSPELLLINSVLAAVQTGESRALVLRGVPGVGKTALLGYAAQTAADMRIARATGVESEMTLAYAGVHQLVAPYLEQLGSLPDPQRDALEAVLGLGASRSTGRLLVGLAVFTLLSNTASATPLLCVVDDAQWLDRESAEVLAFVARRGQADAIGLLFAVREPTDRPLPFDGLAEHVVNGLDPDAARELLESAAAGTTEKRVQERLIADTGGNPLALLELAAHLAPDQLTGRATLPEALPIGERLEQAFLKRVRTLPSGTQTFLLLAAADPTGDPGLVLRAAASLGIGPETAAPAEALGLVSLTDGLSFRHPLLRSAVYGAARSEQRRQARYALAEATDPAADPDRRAWHRAAAVTGPDNAVADELEASADRARRRGGLSTASAYLNRAARLTSDPHRRAARYLAAAEAQITAGGVDAGAQLLEQAEDRTCVDGHNRAQALLLRGVVEMARGEAARAAPVLAESARVFEPLDVPRAAWAQLLSFQAVMYTGRYGPQGDLMAAARRARSSARSPRPTATELFLDAFATGFIDGPDAAVPVLRRAIHALGPEEAGPVMEMATYAAVQLWEDDTLDVVSRRHLHITRMLGGLTMLPLALNAVAVSEIVGGRIALAEALHEELHDIRRIIDDPGIIGEVAPGEPMVAALRGDEERTRSLAGAIARHAATHRLGPLADVAAHGLGVLELGLGHYPAAMEHLRFAMDGPPSFVATSALPDLVESAMRSDERETAAKAADLLSLTTLSSGTPYALGIEARSRALFATGAEAEQLHRTAIDHLRRTRAAVHLARAHHLYGEWLRRARQRREAREQLRTAHELFVSMGAAAFAERARAELEATGAHARRRSSDVDLNTLTPQEAHIARLAAEGAPNAEIAAQLYVSRRTVESHLTKIYAKLGVHSRTQLAGIVLRGG